MTWIVMGIVVVAAGIAAVVATATTRRRPARPHDIYPMW